jgi:predicted NBD/HSP70 family sugar kinase
MADGVVGHHEEATLRETAYYLRLGLAPIIYGLSPEEIVIAGTLVQAWPLIHQAIWDGAAERV